MVATLGRFLIQASVVVAAAGAIVAFSRGALARRFAYAYALLMTAAVGVMEYALITHDFSVGYVAHVGSRAVPLWVTIVSLWSSLEGSILFWGFVLGAYVGAATWLTRKSEQSYAIGTWLACGTFFSFVIAGPANPFGSVSPVPLDGPGPNPLLQNHILMSVHPPFLYLGYVGMTIPFGFACAALLKGKLSSDLLRPMRASMLLTWVFLTIAIMLGGWWAYEVLGWGGYWAWDPVENASLLPWLTATAALHSIMITERRKVLKGWTVTLVQATFLLTVLGTFMTRSGVFNSVHSFTKSAIGPTILAFVAVSLIYSIVLLALRIDSLENEGKISGALSRESMFLVNNFLFVVLTFTVLIGTVFPLIVEALNGKQMSVGRPYFDSMVVPAGAALLFLMGVGPALPWGRPKKGEIAKALLPPLATGAVFVVIGAVFGMRNFWTLATMLFGGYAAHVTAMQFWRGRTNFLQGRRRFAAYLIHAAAILMFVAIAVSSTMRTTHEVKLGVGETAVMGPYTIKFLGAENRVEPHREASVAHFAIFSGGKQIATLEPRMNQYQMMREPIGTPDVYTTLARDLYLSVMSVDVNAQSVNMTIFLVPMIAWIWISVVLMGLGGLLALIPNFSPKPATVTAPKAVEAHA
jgi:cytochrome c-type biogenesis protein CcmF